MRPRPAAVLRLVLLMFMGISGPAILAQTPPRTVKVDCAPILQKMRTDFATDPGRLVLALEDALTTSEVCACPIVRTAVDLAGRDPAVCSQILIAAIHLLPHAAAQITECVLLEAPEATPVIRAALARELGEKSPALLGGIQEKEANSSTPVEAGGKSPAGKQPAPLPPRPSSEAPSWQADEDAGVSSTIGVSGIYFTSPARAATRSSEDKKPDPTDHRPILTTKKPPRRPVSPITRSIPE